MAGKARAWEQRAALSTGSGPPTAREDETAPSGGNLPGPSTPDPGPVDLSGVDRPPGNASTETWREYATSLGLVDDGWDTRADIIAAVDQAG